MNTNESKENHLLNLKVMRLSKPNIPTIPAILSEKDDLPYEVLHSTSSNATIGSTTNIGSNTNGIEALGMTSMLQLQSGVIYLGEIFSSYISLNNHSPYQVNNVFIKVELQTQSQRINLLDTEQQPVNSFGPGFSSDFVVQREVKESGVNILVCAVSYTTPEGENKKFRKFFKFSVMNPLVLKTKIHNLPNIIFLEACLENATQGSLFIESILFEPVEFFDVVDMSFDDSSKKSNNEIDINSNSSNEDILASIKTSPNIVFLKQGHVRQYLFKIIPKDPNNAETKNSILLGRLDITWRSYFGEIGRLKTAHIQRKLNVEEIECILTHIPKVELEKPFKVTATLTNKSNRPLGPQFILVRNKMDGVMINSHLPKLDIIPANTSINVDIEMFPLKPGMQQIVGLAVKLYDLPGVITPKTPPQQPAPKNYYEFGILADIFVENNK